MPNVESSTSAIKTIECDSAEEFLDAISPRSEHFMSLPGSSNAAVRHPEKYIFRGHENDDFSLIPSALRLGQPIKWNQWGRVVISRNREQFRLLRESRTLVGNWTNRHQIKAELAMIFAFFQFADASSLPLPEDSQKLRRILKKASFDLRSLKNDDGQFDWPSEEILSLLALAQHYGVPTRLLDWSRSAFCAAYFAAAGAAKLELGPPSKRPQALSVWGLNIETLGVTENSSPPFGINAPSSIEVITATSASNPNLHSQKGVFTIYRPSVLIPREKVDRKPLNEILETFPIIPELIRFRLPAITATKLLRLLSIEGIHGGTVFAGYRGAAEATLETRHWDCDVSLENVSPYFEER